VVEIELQRELKKEKSEKTVRERIRIGRLAAHGRTIKRGSKARSKDMCKKRDTCRGNGAMVKAQDKGVGKEDYRGRCRQWSLGEMLQALEP